MGDRATVVIKGSAGIAPAAIYGHWMGAHMLDMVRQAADLMQDRKDDEDYASARLCGLCHVGTPGNLSLGLQSPPADVSVDALRQMSPGDAGVILWDCAENSVRFYDGYLARWFGEGKPYLLDEWDEKIAPVLKEQAI